MLKNLVASLLERQVRKLFKKHQPTIIAVTGSVGKTSTKLAIAKVLEKKYKLLVHESFNTEIGLPLAIFNLDVPANPKSVTAWLSILRTMRNAINNGKYPYEVLILEMGADKPGDIKRFMRYITPDIGVVTAIAKVHTEQFKTIEAIEVEKWQLALGSKKVLINAQDKRLKTRAQTLTKPCYTYGIDEGDYHFNLTTFQGKHGFDGMLVFGSETAEAQLPVAAQQSLYPLVAGAAAGSMLKVEPADIVKQLKTWQQPPGRMNVLNGVKGITILDDTYNASPYATVAALYTLGQFRGRKIAILGSMNELGGYTQEGHQLVGKCCGELDLLITIGALARDYLVPAATTAGLKKEQVISCDSPYEAGRTALKSIKEGDIVLAKGSQNGVFAEEAVAMLLNSDKDKKLLVRQSKKWQTIKKKQFQNV